MSDLISRSELIKLFKEHMRTARDFREIIINIIPTIKNQPTAYDIDKIVDELEKIRAKETCNKEKCDTKEICRICVVDDAIEIVKQGGVSDDVCEWTSTQINSEWKPSCEPNSTYNVFGVAWFRKCPYCGKRIKVVE